MEEYGDSLTSVRFSLRSLVVSDDFLVGSPVTAGSGEKLALAARGARHVFVLPITKDGYDRTEIPESKSVEHDIEALVVLQKQFCYVSKGGVFSLDNYCILQADKCFVIPEPISIGYDTICAILQDKDGVHFLSCENKRFHVDCDVGEFQDVKFGLTANRPALVVKIASEKYRIFYIQSLTELKRLHDVTCQGEVIGIFYGMLAVMNNGLYLLDFDSGSIMHYLQDEVFSAVILPILPKPGYDQYILANIGAIKVFCAQLAPGDCIEISEFVSPSTLDIDGLKNNYEPDVMAICSYFATPHEVPQLAGDIFKSVACGIRGCTTNAPQIEEPGKADFYKKDYYYIQITSGYELNAVALHYVSLTGVYRYDAKFKQYPFTSHAERAYENVHFDAVVSTLHADLPTQPQPSTKLVIQTEVSASKENVTPVVQNSVVYISVIPEPIMKYQPTSLFKPKMEDVQAVAKALTPPVVYYPPLRLPEVEITAPEPEAQTVVYMDSAHAQSTDQAAIATPHSDYVAKCLSKYCFNQFAQLVSFLDQNCTTPPFKYDYGCGFNIHLNRKTPEKENELYDQLFNEGCAFLQTEQYNLYCNGSLIMKNSQYQRYNAARRQLLEVCASSSGISGRQDAVLSDFYPKRQAYLARHYQADLTLCDVKLSFIRHIRKHLTKVNK